MYTDFGVTHAHAILVCKRCTQSSKKIMSSVIHIQDFRYQKTAWEAAGVLLFPRWLQQALHTSLTV